ncbi:hypothetical protein ACOBR2_06685 [Telmatobacter bradus]|uniref:hypothetical protein n=1 Tax=Telmatobacter bradus TaxID=474953 RepID=UPI003B433E63
MTTYASTQAYGGLGTVIAIGSVPIAIGEITELPDFMPEWKTVNATNFQSLAEEFTKTIRSGKSVTVKGNRSTADAGQTAAIAAYESTSPDKITITFPKSSAQTTTGDSISFNANILGVNFSTSPDKQVVFSLTFQQTGVEAFTAGS